MLPEQYEVLDENLVKIRAGRMTRRTFVERAVALGLGSSAIASLLEACGGSSGGTTNINWTSEHDGSGVYAKLVDQFNKSNKGVHVNYTNGPNSTDQLRQTTITALRARNGSQDIMSMDIIWPAEFAANGWTAKLDDKWPKSERDKYLPGPVQGCTFNGSVWAAPLRTDAGLLYRRTDVVSSAPATYDDMTNAAAQAVSNTKTKYGYLWQAAQYEGLVCDFIEVLAGYGGSVLDPNDAKKVTVNSPEANAALTKMVSWVGAISPAAITTFMEEDARTSFQNGDSAFMRNWPYAYSLGNDATKSKVAGKFDVSVLPYGGGANTTPHSCIGGWQLGINAFSKNVDAAWEFVKYMLSPDAQKTSAAEASVFATLLSVYDDPDVLAKQPFFKNVKPVFATAVPRPVSPKYPDITTAIQARIHAALTKQSSVADALSSLQSDLQNIVSK
jgi:multiple sugar transport system substrate-binding protein